MTTIRKRTASLLALVLCAALLAGTAVAYERVDADAKTSLELSYRDTSPDVALAGMALRIYQVCSMTDAVRFAFTEGFEGASVAITDDMDAAKWTAMAGTLAAYANMHPEVLPAASGVTGADGKLKFSDLPTGLYLVTGDSVTLGSYRYTPVSFLLTLPSLQTDDSWAYDVTASNKFTRTYLGGGDPSTVSFNVTKVWAEDEGEDRPTAVDVSLLRDGSVYATVTLNEDNRWRHSWTGLSSNAVWTLAETAVPQDYTVLVEQVGNTFVVTNTHTVDIGPPDVPLEPFPPDEPGPDLDPDIDIPDVEVPKGTLPQTGLFWWPVQLLTVMGIAFFSVGLIAHKRGKKDRNEP